MKRIIIAMFLIVSMLMILIPVTLTNTENGAVSDTDGRTLISRPVWGEVGYTSGMEEWLKDRLGLSDMIKKEFDYVNDRLFDELINPIYQYGKNGHVFFKVHSNIEYNEYHELFAKMVWDMQKYCESRGTRFYYVFNPEKEKVYERYLPAGSNYNDKWADSMLAEMDRLGVNYIDLRDTLTDLSFGTAVFNKKYDAGHWNQEGAFYGMKALANVIHNDIPKVKSLEKEEYEISKMCVNKIYGSNQIINEDVPVYSLKQECREITREFADELVMNDLYSHFRLIQNDSDNACGINRLLLFEDDLFAQFAVARSKETAIVTCLQNAINFDYYYNIFNPDVVVFENMEYVVQDRYFSRKAVESAEHNPAILKTYPVKGFSERRDILLEDSEEVVNDVSAVLVPGKAIDRVFISDRLREVSYAYLITDGRVIDLKKNEKGSMTASIRHDDMKVGSNVILFILKKQGGRSYSVINVTDEMKSIAERKDSSANVVFDEETGTYSMKNALAGNAFNYTAIQIYNEEFSKFQDGVVSSVASGKVDGAYSNSLPTGDYTLLLRAGGKMGSEWIAFKTHLVEGQSYWFTYNVEKFSEKEVVISDFSFSKPAETGIEDLTAE